MSSPSPRRLLSSSCCRASSGCPVGKPAHCSGSSTSSTALGSGGWRRPVGAHRCDSGCVFTLCLLQQQRGGETGCGCRPTCRLSPGEGSETERESAPGPGLLLQGPQRPSESVHTHPLTHTHRFVDNFINTKSNRCLKHIKHIYHVIQSRLRTIGNDRTVDRTNVDILTELEMER